MSLKNTREWKNFFTMKLFWIANFSHSQNEPYHFGKVILGCKNWVVADFVNWQLVLVPVTNLLKRLVMKNVKKNHRWCGWRRGIKNFHSEKFSQFCDSIIAFKSLFEVFQGWKFFNYFGNIKYFFKITFYKKIILKFYKSFRPLSKTLKFLHANQHKVDGNFTLSKMC
jgi:hypothetical protein